LTVTSPIFMILYYTMGMAHLQVVFKYIIGRYMFPKIAFQHKITTFVLLCTLQSSQLLIIKQDFYIKVIGHKSS